MWPELLSKVPPDKKAKAIIWIMKEKEKAEYMVDVLIESQPMYTGEINPHYVYWTSVRKALDEL